MIKKVFTSILLVSLAVLAAMLAGVIAAFYAYFQDAQERQLENELRIASVAVEDGGVAYLDNVARSGLQQDCRMTWIAKDGRVLYDTQVPAQQLDNHAQRTEVKEALEKGQSSAVRYSDTLTQQTLYVAMRLEDGSVLRMSVKEDTVLALAGVALQPIVPAIILAVVLSAVLARRMARRLVQPLHTLDLDHPLENDTYEELSPLLRHIHGQREQIDAQTGILRKQTDELAQITSHMSEGLVVLDSDARVLSINPAACRIFGVDDLCAGEQFLRVDRSPELSSAIREAEQAGHARMSAQRNGREYQFDMSRIESDGARIGMVLLAYDVTERVQAECNRREFTANVSHELKTPLQSIVGSAELLESGLVKNEDIPGFVHVIRTQTARLVSLVDDIIRLSQLDEGAAVTSERVDLLEMARKVATDLQPAAAQRNVALAVRGTPACVMGSAELLYELVHNLVDNALKYNIQGGEAIVSVEIADGEPQVTVRDTGIGIPAEYQSRVFERFFRVDKSRSKTLGGTGLGLSIVKHVAQYHDARINLESAPGQGTTVAVLFPAAQKDDEGQLGRNQA